MSEEPKPSEIALVVLACGFVLLAMFAVHQRYTINRYGELIDQNLSTMDKYRWIIERQDEKLADAYAQQGAKP